MTTLLEIPLNDVSPSILHNLQIQYPNGAVLRIDVEPELDFPTFDSAAAFVDYLTDYPALAERNKAYFGLTNAQEKAAFKVAMYADLATCSEVERNAFMEAQARLNEAIFNHMAEMQKRLKRVLKQSKKESA